MANEIPSHIKQKLANLDIPTKSFSNEFGGKTTFTDVGRDLGITQGLTSNPQFINMKTGQMLTAKEAAKIMKKL